MKYKPYSNIVFTIIAISFGQIYSNEAMCGPFDLSKAKPGSDGVISIPNDSGQYLRVEDPSIKIVNAADAESVAMLTFSGNPVKPPAFGFRDPANSVSAKFRINPAASAGGAEETIITHPGNYELRYSPARNDVTLFVYYKEKTPAVNLKGQLLAGKWSAVEILVKGSDIKLTVDGNAVTGSIPGGATMAGAKSFIRIGATQDGARPFAGSLADIAVSEPAQ